MDAGDLRVSMSSRSHWRDADATSLKCFKLFHFRAAIGAQPHADPSAGRIDTAEGSPQVSSSNGRQPRRAGIIRWSAI